MNEEIKNYIDQKIKEHYHNGLDSGILKLENIFGLLKTESTTPTHTPRNFYEQFIIYASGTTYYLYIYDVTNNAWRYATLT